MGLTTWAKNSVLNALLNHTPLQLSPYVALHSDDPGDNGANELSGNNYARVAMLFDVPSGGAIQNTALVPMPTASANWSAAPYGALWDALSGGHCIYGGALDRTITVLSGEYARWAIGALDISASTAFGTDTWDDILAALFCNTALDVTAVYASLHSGDPGTNGANELSGGAYARTTMSFGAAADGIASNDVACETPEASADWTQATHTGLWTALSGGTFIWGRALTTPRTVLTGKIFVWAIGDVDVTFG